MEKDIKKFKHVEIKRHPLRDAWCVHNITFPFIPPYIGTLKQCQKAAESAEKNAEKLLAEQDQSKGK